MRGLPNSKARILRASVDFVYGSWSTDEPSDFPMVAG